jgi:uncharacterized protein YndB with AHSA1/START domain
MSTPVSPVETLHDAVDIAAPPERVWSLVTDLPRMAAWSPQVVRTFLRGTPVQLGTRALNLNRRGPLFWPTRSKVVVFEPHREFAFRVKDNGTIWAFVLEPTADGGTRLVQERRAPDGLKPISTRLQDTVLGGVDTFTAELRDGMRQTLERIKAEAER